MVFVKKKKKKGFDGQQVPAFASRVIAVFQCACERDKERIEWRLETGLMGENTTIKCRCSNLTSGLSRCIKDANTDYVTKTKLSAC